MPTYEYQCKSCKAVYDLRQGFDAERTHKCEVCGKGIAKRVLHAPSVVFKGGGFYATDSRSKSSASLESESKSDSKSTESKSDSDSKSSTESKPKESNTKSEPSKSSTSESSAAS